MNGPTIWICCGVIRVEIEALRRANAITGEVLFLDSMLHMLPEKLDRSIRQTIDRLAETGRIVLVYGDCCPSMKELAEHYDATRVNAVNCVQMLLGPARYRRLMREQAFVLLPEWTVRWREVIQGKLGLSEKIAPAFMHEFHRSLVYLDTGIVPIPRSSIEECAAYTGLPWRVETVSLDGLLALLREAEKASENAVLLGEPR